MPEFKNEFSWSKSRDALFNECLRAYYYHYYGSWNGWRRDSPPDVKELYVMKNLENIPTWIGRVVHEVAEEVVRGMRRGEQLPTDQAVEMARQRAHGDFEDSQSGIYRSKPNRLCGLQEHYYGDPISDESLEEALATMELCIQRLYSTPTYKRMLELGPEGIIEFEKLHSRTVSGYKVWASPDLLVRDLDGRVVVVDWKTGLSLASEGARLQLAVYGIQAVETYGLTPEKLSGLEVNLRSGEEHLYPLNAHTLENTRRYIDSSASRMQALLHDREENIALIRDFLKVHDSHVCQYCRFRRACNRD
jgi:hypothetical protein